MKTVRVVVVLLLLVLSAQITQSANILAIFSYTFQTPYLVVQPYIKALIAKGHNVTIISSVRFLPDIEGVRHIRVAKLDLAIDHILNYEFGSDYLTNKWKGASLAASFYYNTTHAILCDPEVQSMLKDKNEHFDMVVLDPTCSDSLNGFAERFDALQVGLSSFGSSWLVDYKAGNSAPSVYRPISPMGYSHGEGLVNKWNNWILIVEEWIMDQLIYLPIQLELFRRYFAFPPEKFYERRRNFSLMLINQHFSLGRVRSNSPNIIEVGGMHMAEPSPPLDPKLLDFLDGAEHGVIYFSMGMEILNNWLPNKVEENMLQAFSQLKQRVIWKHEMETMPNKSDNIYLTSMASQRLLLEHPNMKLFITHGGLLSLIEAAYAGVPMLGLPVYFDQFDNVERMQQAGVSITMDIATLTVEQLTHNIKELLENPRYALKAKELSSRFRDQPTSPLDRAVWWTEYVLRHKGAPHMRIAEHDMGFVPYYRIQFFSILYGRIVFPALILLIFTYMVVNCVLREFRRIFEAPLYYTELNTG